MWFNAAMAAWRWERDSKPHSIHCTIARSQKGPKMEVLIGSWALMRSLSPSEFLWTTWAVATLSPFSAEKAFSLRRREESKRLLVCWAHSDSTSCSSSSFWFLISCSCLVRPASPLTSGFHHDIVISWVARACDFWGEHASLITYQSNCGALYCEGMIADNISVQSGRSDLRSEGQQIEIMICSEGWLSSPHASGCHHDRLCPVL